MASSCGQCSTQQDGSQEPNQQTSNSKTQTSKAPAAGAALERGCTGACFFRGLVVPGLLLLRPAYSGVGGGGGGGGGFFLPRGGGPAPRRGGPPAAPPPARWSTRRRPRTTALRSGGAFVRRRPGQMEHQATAKNHGASIWRRLCPSPPRPDGAPGDGQEPRRFDLAAPLSVAAPARWSTRRRPRTTALRSGGAFVRRRPGQMEPQARAKNHGASIWRRLCPSPPRPDGAPGDGQEDQRQPHTNPCSNTLTSRRRKSAAVAAVGHETSESRPYMAMRLHTSPSNANQNRRAWRWPQCRGARLTTAKSGQGSPT